MAPSLFSRAALLLALALALAAIRTADALGSRRMLTTYEDYQACACNSNMTSGGVAVNTTSCFSDTDGILVCFVQARGGKREERAAAEWSRSRAANAGSAGRTRARRTAAACMRWTARAARAPGTFASDVGRSGARAGSRPGSSLRALQGRRAAQSAGLSDGPRGPSGRGSARESTRSAPRPPPAQSPEECTSEMLRYSQEYPGAAMRPCPGKTYEPLDFIKLTSN